MTPQQVGQNIISFIFSPQFTGTLWFIRAVFIFFSLLLLGAITILLIKSSWLNLRYVINAKEFFGPKYFEVKKFLKQWENISKRLKSTKEAEWKLGVIEANNFFGEILARMGKPGTTVAEQLQKIDPAVFPGLDIDMITEALAVCNNITHDPDYRLTLEQAEKAIKIYEKTLKDLDIL